MNDLLRRQRALQKTVAKYRGRAFERGRADCATMFRSHLVAMGHKGIPKIPVYRNEEQAKKRLAEMGHKSLESLLDSLLPRIPYAHALEGDIVLVKGEDSLDCIMVKISARKVMGWWGGYEVPMNVTPHEVIGAWRA